MADNIVDSAESFSKAMTAISFWTRGDLDTKKFKKNVSGWLLDSEEFLRAMKVVKPVQTKLASVVESLTSGKLTSDKDDEDLEYIGKFMYVSDNRLEQLTEIDSTIVKFIRQNAMLWRSNSDNAYNFLHKNASKIDASFSAEMIDEILPSQIPDALKLIDTIEKLTGRRDVKLGEEEKEEIRKKHPDDYQVILRSRRNINDIAKKYVQAIIRRSGKKMIAYSELLNSMRDDEIFHDFPKAEDWDGLVDEEGSLYTAKGQKIKGKPGFTIIGNEAYNPKTDDTYVFTCITSMNNVQYFYTEDALKNWKEERFEAVDDFAPMIQHVRSGWLADLNKKGNKVQRLAVLCEILYWASARIGGEKNNVRGAKTFGISTLQGRHVSKVGSNLVIDYIGKMGHRQKHILTPKTREQKIVATLLLEWAEEAGEDGAIFDLKGGYTTPPTNMTVNSYFKSKGATVTVHKLRHARATEIMERQISDPKVCPYFKTRNGERSVNKAKAPDQRQAEKLYLEMATEVGKELGHTSGEKITPMTSVNSYINPTTTTSFFKDLALRLPSWARKFDD